MDCSKCKRNADLHPELVFRWEEEDSEASFQDTEDTFDDVAERCVAKVEKFFFVSWSEIHATPLSKVVANPVIGCQELVLQEGVPGIRKKILAIWNGKASLLGILIYPGIARTPFLAGEHVVEHHIEKTSEQGIL